MDTKIQVLNPDDFAPEELDEACEVLRRGGLVAFPTETVYGLGGDALRQDVSAGIYEAKGRPSDNPLIVHIAKIEDIEKIARDVPAAAFRLAEAFWPGPLTMVLRKKDRVPSGTTGGLDTVAIRLPAHPVARALIERSGLCVAAPSANASGRPSPTLAAHVIEDLDGRIDYILDGGKVGIGLESTIVDLTGEEALILRPGAITAAMLRDIIGKAEYDPAVLAKQQKQDVVAKAPGMKYRHYAPKGDMTLVEGQTDNVARYICRLLEEGREKGSRMADFAVLAYEETKERYEGTGAYVYSFGSRENEAAVAAALYDTLRQMDNLGVRYIYAESFVSDGLGQAIMNRLRKAAAYQVVDADTVQEECHGV